MREQIPMVLYDGKKYWLGAAYGIYHIDGDYFDLGNSIVSREYTLYADIDTHEYVEIDSRLLGGIPDNYDDGTPNWLREQNRQ